MAFNPAGWLVRLVPALTLLLGLLVSVVPLPLPWFGSAMPPVLTAMVFLWAIYRPEWLPLPFVFAIGLLQDVLLDMPLGLNATLLAVIYWPIVWQRRIFLREPFPFLWFGFAVILLPVELLRWLVLMLLSLALMPASQMLADIMLGCGMFPLLGWLLIRLNHLLPERLV